MKLNAVAPSLLLLISIVKEAAGNSLRSQHREMEAAVGTGGRRELLGGEESSSRSRTAFALGFSIGVAGILIVVILVGLCIRWLQRHRRRLSTEMESPKKEVIETIQITPVSPRKDPSALKGRISFMRSALSQDASLRAIEHLELEQVEFGPSLGRGAFGRVYRGSYAGIPLAIKVFEHDGALLCQGNEPLETYLSRNTDHPNVVKTFVNETRRCQLFNASTSILSTAPSPASGQPLVADVEAQQNMTSSSRESDDEFSYIARAMGTGDSDDSYRTLIVMEFCDKGSLDHAIRDGVFFLDRAPKQSNIRFVLRTAFDIACAMTYLHQQRIVHGDLKSQNVLLKQSEHDERGFICKVGDFGLSRVIINKTHIDTFTHGTVSHSAPELLRDGLLTPAADVYSFGMLLWELLSGRKAYTGAQHDGIIIAVTRGIRPAIPSYCPLPLAQLICDCWDDAYNERPTFEMILRRLDIMLRLCEKSEFDSMSLGAEHLSEYANASPGKHCSSNVHEASANKEPSSNRAPTRETSTTNEGAPTHVASHEKRIEAVSIPTHASAQLPLSEEGSESLVNNLSKRSLTSEAHSNSDDDD